MSALAAPAAPFRTISGRVVDLLDPQPATIDIGDIAHHLSRICRFGGAIEPFWSVADHCLLCVELMLEHGDPRLARPVLVHDGHEYVLTDLPNPVKRLVGPRYPALALDVDLAIARALNVDLTDLYHPLVRQVDLAALYIEARQFGYELEPDTPPPPRDIPIDDCEIQPLPDARERFIAVYQRLTSTSPRAFTGGRPDTLPQEVSIP
jgi:hypothetical protein